MTVFGIILRWHQGILISSHLDQYKLVGLCVPERLTVHDLINSQDKVGLHFYLAL
jgi:hypothetical protein